MKVRILAVVLLLAAPAAAPDAAESPDVGAVIGACREKLDAQDVGYDHIIQRCPELAPALERSGWAAWLPQGWKESRNDLSAGSLLELETLVKRELAARASTPAPRVERLKEILTDLGTTGQQRSGAWTRFKKWVRSLFERAGQQNRQGWLSRLVSRAGVSDTVIELITYVALALVVALAGFIVFNELRLARLLWRKRAAGGDGADADWAGARPRLTWSDVERAALLDRPRLLLELIAARLTDLGRLPPAGAFTARELARAANLNQPADRERLNAIALTAERARYAADGVSPASAEAAVGNARELLARLDSRDAAPSMSARAAEEGRWSSDVRPAGEPHMAGEPGAVGAPHSLDEKRTPDGPQS
jgi:hypothetical protein